MVTTKDCSRETIEEEKMQESRSSEELGYEFKKDEIEVEEDVEVDKLVDTHLGMSHEDIINDKDKYYIELPKYS